MSFYIEEVHVTISSAQCRAARAMLDWSQDQLAQNAQVARPTIADFERNIRQPMRNNLLSIVSTFEAAGLAFIPENGEGAGVRFRKVELEYNRSIKTNGDDMAITVRYRGKKLSVIVPGEIIDDMDRTIYDTTEERTKALQNHLPKYLVAAERIISNAELAALERVVLTHADFPAGTF